MDDQELEIRKFALRMGIERATASYNPIDTFEWVGFFEDYLRGKDARTVNREVNRLVEDRTKAEENKDE